MCPERPEGRNCKQMIKNRPPVHRQAIQTGKCKKVSQSLRPQAQRKWKSFSPAACTSEKIPLGSQTCEGHAAGVPFVRCSEPLPHSNESPVKRVSFESLSKILF